MFALGPISHMNMTDTLWNGLIQILRLWDVNEDMVMACPGVDSIFCGFDSNMVDFEADFNR